MPTFCTNIFTKQIFAKFVTKKMQIFSHAKTNVKLGYYLIPAIVNLPLFFIYVFTNYVDIQKVAPIRLVYFCTDNRYLNLTLYLYYILYMDRVHNNINNEKR